MKNSSLFLLCSILLLFSCACNKTVDETVEVVNDVDPALFVSTGLAQTITIVPCTLSDGSDSVIS